MTDNIPSPEFLTAAQVAKRLGVSRRSVPDLMRQMGVVKYAFTPHVIRYDAAGFEEAIKRAATRE